MKRFWLVALIAVTFLSCAREPQVRVEVQKVEVPVAVPCPEPPAIPRPTPLAPGLPANASNQAKAQAVIRDLSTWIAYSLELEKTLDGYRQPAKSTEATK